jgi:hypothetical protein
MIIYGTNGSRVRTEPAPGMACPACSNAEQMKVTVFSRYAHVYWIPLVPYTKPVVAECTQCRGWWELDEVPKEAPQVRQALQALKKETASPWWQWSGLMLVGLLVSWGVVAASIDDKDNATYIAAPHTGDIYTVREEAGTNQYSLLKVVGVHGNAVDLVANEYAMNDSQPLQKLNLPDNFSKDTFSVTLLDLLTMKNKGQITDVDRLSE